MMAEFRKGGPNYRQAAPVPRPVQGGGPGLRPNDSAGVTTLPTGQQVYAPRNPPTPAPRPSPVAPPEVPKSRIVPTQPAQGPPVLRTRPRTQGLVIPRRVTRPTRNPTPPTTSETHIPQQVVSEQSGGCSLWAIGLGLLAGSLLKRGMRG